MTGGASWTRNWNRAHFGLKGREAADWLRVRSWPVPSSPNTWASCAGDGVVVRLGDTEFFVQAAPELAVQLWTAQMSTLPHAYRVLRQDASFSLEGVGAHDVLAQVCNVNFEELNLSASPVVMTLMIGVAVLVLPDQVYGRRRYRIWCDPSFGEYLHRELSRLCEQSLGALV